MSLASQWDLVCNRQGLAETSQTIYIFGQLFGGLASPYFIDRFGRKPPWILSNFLLVIINLICAFSPSYAVFASMRFFAGIFREAYTITIFTAITELYSKRKRVLMSGISTVLWSVWSSVGGAAAYLLKDYCWNVIYLFNAAVSGCFIMEVFFLTESIRWLFANSKVKQAKKVIKMAAKLNNVDFEHIWSIALKNNSVQEAANQRDGNNPDNRHRDPQVLADDAAINHTKDHVKEDIATTDTSKQPSEKEMSKSTQLKAIFKIPYLRKITIAISICWMIDITSFTSLYFMVEALGGSVYFNFSMLGVAEVVSSIFYSLGVSRFGHKISLIFSKTFTAILTFSAGLLMLLAGNTLYIPWASGFTMGSACLISAVLVWLFLPETKNNVLMQTIEDVQKMRAEEKSKSIRT
eukprot:XP_014780511.1 PREDICTED: solute carrier family 22 member 7-like [Octopus bimaculoides]